MSSGLQFRKVDLHTHTPASACFLDKSVTPEALVQSAINANLSAIAITDHNTGAWVDLVKGAAAKTQLVVFPGVEITLAEGLHVVALFDTDKGAKDIASLLGALDITPDMEGKSETLCRSGIRNVINKVVERKGLCILAHIDQPKGALTALNGQPLIQLINSEPYSAIETSEGELPDALNRSRGFRRLPACYQASDNPDPNNPTKHSVEGLGQRYSYFKVDDPISLEGLRQCFADPSVRIRKMGVLESPELPRILDMRVSDGFLKDQELRFHKGLNSIIGGKGVGKSLIVEFIRFALGQPPSDDGIVKDHNGKLAKRLGEGNSVEVTCRLGSGATYSVKRTFGGAHTCTNLETSQPVGGRIDELFPILAYSQTEVIKIAEDGNAQLKLIDGFIDPRPHLNRVNEISVSLTENGRKLAVGIRAGIDLDTFKKDLETLDGKIAEIDRSLAASNIDATLLSDFKALEAKYQAFESLDAYLNRLRESVSDSREHAAAIVPPDLAPEHASDPDLAAAREQAHATWSGLLIALDSMSTGLTSASESLAQRIATWLPTFEDKRKEYEAALEKVSDKTRLDTERRRLLNLRKDAQLKLDGCKALADGVAALDAERTSLLDQLELALRQFYLDRKAVFDTIASRSNGKLKLELKHAANPKAFQDKLKALVYGSRARGVDIEAISTLIRPRKFVELVRQRNTVELSTTANITTNSAQTIIDKLWSSEDLQAVLDIECQCYPADVPAILFRKPDRKYAPLDELSVGQKCTALLIIALSDGARPVIIDQPEDALDLKTVWEDVTVKLREGKEKRQFILTTHNTSVSVASDSDMFIVVQSNAKQAEIECLGAIEVLDVKKAVVQLLEGGKEPYALKQSKYNLDHLQ